MQILRKTLGLLALVTALAPMARAGDPLKVLCTLPDLECIVDAVGGDLVECTSVATGKEDLHRLRLRPSHVVAASRADMFVQMGLSLEHAWVPGLLQTARNKSIQPGSKGFIDMGAGWTPIEVPQTLSLRVQADVHPQGNPHFHMDPGAGRYMAERIAATLRNLRPADKEQIDRQLGAYLKRLARSEEAWASLGPLVKGRKVVVFHRDFSYLLRRMGIVMAGNIEPKPGMTPTASHLAKLVEMMRTEDVDVILVTPGRGVKFAERLGEMSGAKVLLLPGMVGGAPGVDTWIGLQDYLHASIAKGLGVEWSKATGAQRKQETR